jgi:tRNA-dihydrouridine synthase 3
VTKAEKIERNGVNGKAEDLDEQEPAAKRIKLEDSIETVAGNGPEEKKVDSRDKVKGIALVKTELVS